MLARRTPIIAGPVFGEQVTLASQGLIFATHNLGLARAVSEQIYSVRATEGSGSTLRPFEAHPNLTQLLGELNYSGYQDLGTNKVLLVEGTTEVKTFQQWLRKYKKDHEIVLLPLGGGSLIRDGVQVELGEIQRISTNVSAIIDSERTTAQVALAPERLQFQSICNDIGIKCHVLDRRATENYLTDAAVKQVKGPKYNALKPYEELKNLQLSWSKSENWRIAREMENSDLDSTDLGCFLRSL